MTRETENTQLKALRMVIMLLLFVVPCKYAIADDVKPDKEIEELSQLSMEELMNIEIIEATKTGETISDIPASVYILSREEIDKLGFSSYTDLLNYICGYVMIDDYHYLGHKNFSVRGFFSPGAFGNVIVLVNGVPQLSDEYMDYSDAKITVPIHAIDKIEVIKGPMAVTYGNGAFFGAINIITNRDCEDNAVSAGIGNYGALETFGRFSGSVEDIQYRMNLGFKGDAGLDVPYSELTSNNGILDYANVSPEDRTGGLLEHSSRYFDFSFEDDGLFGIFSYNESAMEVMDGMPSVGEGSEITHFATNMNVGYKKDFTERFSFKGMVGYYMHSHNLDYERIRPHSFSLDSKKSRAFDVDISSNLKFFNDKMKLLVGFYTRNVLELYQVADFPEGGLHRGDGEIMIPRDDIMATNALYSQITYTFAEKIDIIAGVRVEHVSPYEISYTRGVTTLDTTHHLPPKSRTVITGTVEHPNHGLALTPRVAALYRINDNNVLKLLYGNAVKHPTFMDNLRQLIQDRPWLASQEIQTFEMNYIWQFCDNCKVNASVFYNQLDGLIVQNNEFDPETGWNFYGSNSGEMETIGGEICFRTQINTNIWGKFSAIYQKSSNLKEGYEDIDLGYSPDLSMNMWMGYSLKENYHFVLLGRYIDEMKAAWFTETTPAEGTRLGETIPAYLVLDANIRVDNILNTGLFANFSVKNILDTEIRYPTTASNSWLDKGTLGYGRQFLLNVGYSF
jgi:outer membrane receptor protein involved in Fe transport